MEFFADVEAMVAFVEAHGDTVIARIDDHAGCSHQLVTAGGYCVAFNGYIHKVRAEDEQEEIQ